MTDFVRSCVYGLGPIVLFVLAVIVGVEWVVVLVMAGLLAYSQYDTDRHEERFRVELERDLRSL